MIDLRRDIHSLTDFKRNTNDFMKQMKETKSPVEIAKHFRPLYNGTIIINKGFTKATGEKIIEDGYADLVAFGVPFLANPDLVNRFKTDARLNTPQQASFYTTGATGYIDYPALVD